MYIGSINTLKPTFRHLYDQALFIINNGGAVDVELAKHKQKRTLEQNNYYWVFCEELAKFFQQHEIMHIYEVCGVKIKVPFKKETVHENLNKPLFGVETTTKMSIGEFCEYMTKLLIYWQDKTNNEFQMSELPANYLEKKGYTIK